MATLPPGWAADYDGQRWFYCYTATSHTQYHFPKPGDEFPEFSLMENGSSNDGLLPEEKLESERQVRKRAALRGSLGRTTNGKRSGEEDNDDPGKQDDKENGKDEEIFCFESFAYLGPRSCSGMMSLGHTMDDRTGKAAQSSPSSNYASEFASVVEIRTGTGENKDENKTPPMSEPSTKAHANVCDHTKAAFEIPTFPLSEPSFLYDREIAPSPPRNIAELVSESTALCEEEINPPPVELPATGTSRLEPRPVPDLFNQCPVELPTLEGPSSRRSMTIDEVREVHEPRQETSKLASTDEVDDNKSTWCTNWMSTSTEAEAPPRPPKVMLQSHFPLRQGDFPPQLASKTTSEEKLHQEILDFFPAVLPRSEEDTKIFDDANGASSTIRDTETSRPIIPTSALSHCPSVLRPGPRRRT